MMMEKYFKVMTIGKGNVFIRTIYLHKTSDSRHELNEVSDLCHPGFHVS